MSFIRKMAMSMMVLITALTVMILSRGPVSSASGTGATESQEEMVNVSYQRPRMSRAARIRAARARAARIRARGYAIRRGKIVRFAMRQRGKPYVFGAVGPRSYDCSGLTLRSARAGRVRLPRIASAQYRHLRHTSKRRARAGDLVFWLSGGSAEHVGVYLGHGRVVHAPQPGDSVKVSGLWGSPRFAKILP